MKALELRKKYKTILDKADINTKNRLSFFFGHTDHESGGFKLERENMNYSVKRLIEVFKKRFDRNKDGWLDDNEKKKILEIAGNPRKIANFVYANRYGNGSEESGDGWKYRAGGYIGITFKENYKELSEDTKIDFLNNPDLLNEEANAIVAAIWFWKKHGLNSFADNNDIEGSTKEINGGFNGLKERKELIEKYKKIF